MLNVKIEIADLNEDEINDIVDFFDEELNVTITIKKPWPPMKVGDLFTYNEDEYLFIAYSPDKERAKCISVEVLINDSVIQPVSFDCSEITNKFKFKEE